MKFNVYAFRIVLIIILMASVSITQSQQLYRITGEQEFKVEGTSTIHDWEMISKQVNGSVKISLENDGIKDIMPISMSLPVNTLKSGKNGMDGNAYKALKSKQYPEIKFELTKIQPLNRQSLKAFGNLTIAGTTQKMEVMVNYSVTGNEILLSGSFPVTFSQFQIDPPTAMLGTIKTGDDLKISFKSVFKLEN